jgi:hypothetical protein
MEIGILIQFNKILLIYIYFTVLYLEDILIILNKL